MNKWKLNHLNHLLLRLQAYLIDWFASWPETSPPFLLTHELLDIYLLFCIGDEYLLFSITAQVTTRLLLDKMYQPLKISILLKVAFILRVHILSDLVTVTSHIQVVDLNSLQLS